MYFHALNFTGGLYICVYSPSFLKDSFDKDTILG